MIVEEITFDFFNGNQIFFESSIYTPNLLKELEKTIDQMKNNLSNREARQKFIELLTQITGVKHIVLLLKPDFNAGISPIYKNSLPKKLSKIFTEVIGKLYTKRVDPILLKEMQQLFEKSDQIDHIYLFLGKDLLKKLTSAEIVAVLLHEFGHMYSRTSNIPFLIHRLFKNILINVPIVNTVLFLNKLISPEIFMLILTLYILNIHGMSFVDRIGEYTSDEYAVRYGYGDELISLFQKFKDERNRPLNKKQTLISEFQYWIKQIIDLLFFIFTPGEHPDVDKRIETIRNLMKTRYKKIYPERADEVDLIIDDIEKQQQEI